jgi:uncharacterized protein YecE (DUF72 family)
VLFLQLDHAVKRSLFDETVVPSASSIESPPGVFLGTSGYSYGHWRGGVFYPRSMPQRLELTFYAREFGTVEINNTFYRMPEEPTFESWRERTPEGFVFAVKASRFITHIKRLRDCEEPLERLLQRARGLGDKLGPCLFQLPPRANIPEERLEHFLAALAERLGKGELACVEMRDPSALTERALRALERHEIALCWPFGPRAPLAPERLTGPFAYVRMHEGRGQDGRFTDEEIEDLARRVQRVREERLPVYVYFNNDWRAHAIEDARRLRALLLGTGRPASPVAPVPS